MAPPDQRSASAALVKMVPSLSLVVARSLTDDVVEGGMIGAGEEVGEEVDHDEAVLLALKLLNLY